MGFKSSHLVLDYLSGQETTISPVPARYAIFGIKIWLRLWDRLIFYTRSGRRMIFWLAKSSPNEQKLFLSDSILDSPSLISFLLILLLGR